MGKLCFRTKPQSAPHRPVPGSLLRSCELRFDAKAKFSLGLAEPGGEKLNSVTAYAERAGDIIFKGYHLSSTQACHFIKAHLELCKHSHKLHFNRFNALRNLSSPLGNTWYR